MRTARAALIAVVLACSTACGSGSSSHLDVDVVGTPEDPFERGVRLSAAGQLVRAATSEGLVRLDQDGRVIPGLAERWIVTDDGLSYIFRLRDRAWADGTAITGETVRTALRQALAGVAGTSLALDLAAIEEVRAMAGRVVEIRLRRATPDLLQLLAQPELGLLHRGLGSGPMAARRDGAVAVLALLPEERLDGSGGQAARQDARILHLRSLPASAATARFAEGKVDIVLGGRFENLAQAQAVAGLSRRPLRLDPVPGLFGLAFASSRGWLALAECREALAMAVDREAIGPALGLGNWAGTTAIVPPTPGEAGLPARWRDRTALQRRAEAGTRLARCKARSGDPGTLRLALPDGPGADALHARLAEDFAAIGVGLARVPARAAGDLRLLDIAARSARAEWYLHQLSCAILRGPCSAAADARLMAAGRTTDPAQAAQLVAQAVAVQEAENLFIPLASPVRWSLVRDRVAGFAPNPAGIHPLPPLARQGL